MPFVSSANCGSANKVRTRRRIERKDSSLSRDADVRLWRNWRRHSLQQRAPTHLRKHQDVEEMHGAEHEHDYANFPTDRFKHFANICGSNALLQRQRHVTDVDKIESNYKKVIH